MERRRLAFLPLLAVVVLPGCGGKLTARDVANQQRELNPRAFADIGCVADRSSGWDYVCTYTDTQLGREKIGVVAHGGASIASGSVPVADDLPDGPHMKPPSPAEYARRANAVCAKRVAAVRALPKPTSGSELLDVGERMVSLEELERSRLAGITPPAAEQAQVARLLKSIKEIERATEAFRGALTRRDAADVVHAEAHLKTVRRLATTTARGLGLDCPY